MNALIITHIADLDGISSGALIMRKYKINKNNILFADYNKEKLLETESLFNKKYKKGMTLFITDIGASTSTADIFKRMILKVKKNKGKVFWFDHHVWSDELVKELASFCDIAVVNENKLCCAAEITAKELDLKDNFTNKLLKIVHMADFNIKPKDKKTKDFIGSYVLSTTYYSSFNYKKRQRITKEIAEQISKGIILPKFLVKDSEMFKKINEKRLKELLKNIKKSRISAIGFTKFVSTNDACESIQKQCNVDIGIYINTETSKAHLRSKFMDCSVLARSFGGGGHPHASAFEINKNEYNLKLKEDRDKISDIILKKVYKLYQNSKS
ncbi:MAG: hypothetical protein QXD23_00410 [Candidatus Micrarchaeaceae archaeon]